MNKIALGQFYNTDSFIHRLDPRMKIIISICFMFAIFIVEFGDFLGLSVFAFFTLIVVILSRVPIIKFLKGIKHVVFVLILTFLFSTLLSKKEGEVYIYVQSITIVNVFFSMVVLIIFLSIKKYLPVKILFFTITVVICIIIMHYPVIGKIMYSYEIELSKDGMIMGLFLVTRVFVLIIFSCTLTLTTKPTDINNGLESLLHPLTYLKINVAIFSMMISIALRNIPTLFLEAEKILKAQASRGVDFKDGKFNERIFQIISLIIPMFIVSFRKSADIADAMEARGYIPGRERTKLAEMRLKKSDFVALTVFLITIGIAIYFRTIYAV